MARDDAKGERGLLPGAPKLPHENTPVWHRPSNVSKFRLVLEQGFDNWRDKIGQALQHEVEIGTVFNLLPAAVAIGIAVYFLSPAEPNALALFLTFAVLALVQMKTRSRRVAYYGLALATAIFAGMSFGKLAVLSSANHAVERQVTTRIIAIVLNVDKTRKGAPRYLVRPLVMEKNGSGALPARLRISASSKSQPFTPGDTIEGLARLQPVLGPVLPRSYDFSFFAWFERLGGSGFFMGAPIRSETIGTATFRERIMISTNQFRSAIENRIVNAVPGRNGAILVALVTGNRSGIPSEIQQSLRLTGLAHILAISGLHMALVTLTVVWLVRALLARNNTVALHYPVKKIAVCAGFASASIYLVISGAGVATQRAWIMITVMLLAVLLDKRAITMRSVAIAALVILAVSPQSLFAPGFQMSFAAVASLVAGYEVLNRRRRLGSDNTDNRQGSSAIVRTIGAVSRYMVGILLTSLIAGTATAFVAAWHFHQIAPLGLLANVLAMPFVTILIMPFLLLSVLLMPYGLEAVALTPASYGVDQVIAVAGFVADKSPSGMVGSMHPVALVLFAIFLCWLTIPKTRLRLLSFAFLPIAFVLPKTPPIPDILVAENGRTIAVKGGGNELAILKGRAGGFVTEIWRKSYSLAAFSDLQLSREQCGKDRCIYVLPDSKVLHITYDPKLLQSSCQRADILIAPRLWWVNCKGRKPDLILKRHDFEQYGTHAIHLEPVPATAGQEGGTHYRIERALPDHSRPWHRRVPPKE